MWYFVAAHLSPRRDHYISGGKDNGERVTKFLFKFQYQHLKRCRQSIDEEVVEIWREKEKEERKGEREKELEMSILKSVKHFDAKSIEIPTREK